ncbi:hypothetical protein KNP414_06334 [Paenibacillus mucilaginosus KNP414]|uniref:Uncharacterized protein n=1 Tax=Paenibacillus mucilaginosus (strain KNP414) TaxID=1036673 RepID=F8FLT9_PAEMK|nr:hypothetical protein KNP414_06334 [Paenibacillus mucilaginosus KNP414]
MGQPRLSRHRWTPPIEDAGTSRGQAGAAVRGAPPRRVSRIKAKRRRSSHGKISRAPTGCPKTLTFALY